MAQRVKVSVAFTLEPKCDPCGPRGDRTLESKCDPWGPQRGQNAAAVTCSLAGTRTVHI